MAMDLDERDQGLTLIIGAMKCGTTQLYHTLASHSEVVPCALKEPNFFLDSQRGNWSRGTEWYKSLFRDLQGIRLEASTSYAKDYLDPGIALRIRSFCPDAKLIFVFRNPVDRAISHYFHGVTEQREVRPIHEALLDKTSKYIILSLYYRQLRPYLNVFPNSQILIIEAELMWSSPREVIRKVLCFLNLQAKDLPLSANRHSTADRIIQFKRLARGCNGSDLWLPRVGSQDTQLPVPSSRDLGESIGITEEVRCELMNYFTEDGQQLQNLIARHPTIALVSPHRSEIDQ